MIAEFVALLMASAGATLAPPTGQGLSLYSGSLVQISWTNSSANQTRVYRKSGAGSWSLIASVVAGVTSYQTGDSLASGYDYGVAHYNTSTGAESSVAQAADTAPPSPTGTSITYYD